MLPRRLAGFDPALDVGRAPADATSTQLDRRWKLAFANPAIQRCFLDADAIQHTNKSKNLKSHFLFRNGLFRKKEESGGNKPRRTIKVRAQ